MIDLTTILTIATRQLPAAGVECLLIGGFAVSCHGYTRNTLDVDFIIAGDQLDIVKRVMVEAGFTNVSVEDNVAFFTAPGSPMRVDFLRTDRKTMDQLLANAITATLHGCPIKVPSLEDLLAMKIFALSHGVARRRGKDLPDIAYLIAIHNLDLESVVRPLCERFGTQEVYALVRDEVQALRAP